MLRAPTRSSAGIQTCVVMYQRPSCLPCIRKREKETSGGGEQHAEKKNTFYRYSLICHNYCCCWHTLCTYVYIRYVRMYMQQFVCHWFFDATFANEYIPRTGISKHGRTWSHRKRVPGRLSHCHVNFASDMARKLPRPAHWPHPCPFHPGTVEPPGSLKPAAFLPPGNRRG